VTQRFRFLPEIVLQRRENAPIERLRLVGAVGRQIKKLNSVLLAEVHELRTLVSTVFVEDEQAPFRGI
jgi:hypothetical protein